MAHTKPWAMACLDVKCDMIVNDYTTLMSPFL